MKRFLIMLLAILMLIPTTEVQAAKKKKVKIATPTYEIAMRGDPDHIVTDEEIKSGKPTGVFQIKFKCKTKGVKIKMIQQPLDDWSVPVNEWTDFLYGDDWGYEGYMSDAMEYQHKVLPKQKLTFYAYKGKYKSKKVTIMANEIVMNMYNEWADKSKEEYYNIIRSDMSDWVDENADDVTKIIGICRYFRDSGKFEYSDDLEYHEGYQDSKRWWYIEEDNCDYLAVVFAHACHAYNINCIHCSDSDDESYFVNNHAWCVLSLDDGILIVDPTTIINSKYLYAPQYVSDKSNWSPSYAVIEAAVNGGN